MRKPVFGVSDHVQPGWTARDLGFRKKRACNIFKAKTKALIKCVVTAQLICIFSFSYAKSKFSLDTAQLF